MKKTFYEFLGVSPDASSEEIKAVSQYLAKKFHPSTYPGNKRIAANFNKIKLVYKTLANPAKRKAYDIALAKLKPASTLKSEPLSKMTTKNQPSNDGLWRGEKIVYRASIHWFGYLQALLFVGISAYFLWLEPAILETYLAKFDFLQDKLKYIKLGLFGGLVFGILILLQTLSQQLTTTLLLTSHRIIAKFGLISKQEIAMAHAQFEHIEVKTGILGKIFGFGTVKIRGQKYDKGTGGTNIRLKRVAAAKKMEKRLLRLVKQSNRS